MHGVALAQLIKLDKVRAVLVDDGVEGETIAPAGREVPHVDIMISRSFHLAPEKQRIFRRLGLLVIGFFNCYVLDLNKRQKI